MNSYNEDLKLSELLDWLASHNKKLCEREWNEKHEELMDILTWIDRIGMREFVHNKLADITQILIEINNDLFQKLSSSEQIHGFYESGLHWPGVWARNMFKLVPPFIKQGIRIPENLKTLYSESRRCFIFEQFNAAVVLSRGIIEVALKQKIGLPIESKKWTAGVVLEKALEKKIINDSVYWIANKVITKADKILHQGGNVDFQETLNALDHTKQFLEELFD
jgi:hypothetical protein